MSAPATGSPVIVTAQRVHTFAPGPAVEAVNALLLEAGRVRATGTLEALRRQAPDAHIVDFPAATITPGLTDSHIHITEWAMARREIDLSAARSPEQAAQHVGTQGRGGQSGWLLGRGWNPHHWGGDYPHHAILDATVPAVPAAFQSHDMHALWVNSRALELASIDAQTPDPPGGRIVRETDGSPTGVLLENAATLVTRCITAPSDSEIIEAVLAAQAELHAYGITGIHSLPGLHRIEPPPLRVLQTLLERDRLRLRVLQHIALDRLDDAIAMGLRSGLGGEYLRVGGIKMFLDGALGSRTAWLREPYEGSTDRGVRVLSDSDFRQAVQHAAAAGLASTVHAIGDAAVALAFDVLTAADAQAGTLPNRIEHVQCCPPDRLSCAARAGIVCSMQPCHLMSDWQAADRHWGPARTRSTYAFRSLLRHQALLAFGSDAPVEPCDPRLGFYAAVARRDLEQQPAAGWVPEERIAIDDVLRAYTIGPARAAGAAAWQGRLAQGYVADFVVWDRDPQRVESAELLSLRVLATYVSGELVYRAG